ncbi:hypothetical protein C8R46DRAFT_1056548, partial [Mycena filopes]
HPVVDHVGVLLPHSSLRSAWYSLDFSTPSPPSTAFTSFRSSSTSTPTRPPLDPAPSTSTPSRLSVGRGLLLRVGRARAPRSRCAPSSRPSRPANSAARLVILTPAACVGGHRPTSASSLVQAACRIDNGRGAGGNTMRLDNEPQLSIHCNDGLDVVDIVHFVAANLYRKHKRTVNPRAAPPRYQDQERGDAARRRVHRALPLIETPGIWERRPSFACVAIVISLFSVDLPLTQSSKRSSRRGISVVDPVVKPTFLVLSFSLYTLSQ